MHEIFTKQLFQFLKPLVNGLPVYVELFGSQLLGIDVSEIHSQRV